MAPQKRDSDEIQTEQEQESKRAEGENMAAKNYHFNIKRMLSQQSNRATPFNCDTIQLLITLSGARRKATVSQAQARCLLNQRAGSGEKCAYCSDVKSSKRLFSHPSMKMKVGKGNEVCLPMTVKAISEA